MDSNTIYRVIIDQREELTAYADPALVSREEAQLIEINSPLAQVVIGVRRSGKSTLCHMALQAAGVDYAYVNFDDDRLADLRTEDLNLILENIYRVYGPDVKYLFFDEIQNVDGWYLFVNRLLRLKFHVFVTGSNARLLSSELASHLTGRSHEIRLYPFSFKDFCSVKGLDCNLPTTRNVALLKNALDEYLMEGGFPELMHLGSKQEYISNLLDTIITKDIMRRYRLRNANGLKTLANHLLNNAAQLINMTELTETLGIGSDKTVRNYLDYLGQAFLIVPLQKFSYKSAERLRQGKAFAVDSGLLTYRRDVLSSANMGWRLENAVLLELRRRNHSKDKDIFYYKPSTNSREVDFAVTERGQLQELIQVSYDVSSPKTLKREIDALKDAACRTGCRNLTLVACTDSRKVEDDGLEINIVSAVDWLLGNRLGV